MEKIYSKIGDRIRTRRKECGFRNQSDFAETLFPNSLDESDSKRKKISYWESGRFCPTIIEMIALCNVLDCEIDYLIGAIDVPHRKSSDVMESTGLSRKAVEKLQEMKNRDIDGLNIVSKLLETYMIPSVAKDLEIWSHPERETPIEDVLREITKYLYAPKYSGNKYKGILMSWKDIIRTACHFRINSALDKLRDEITSSFPLVRDPDDAQQQADYDKLNPHKKANEEGEAANGEHKKDTRRKRDKL